MGTQDLVSTITGGVSQSDRLLKLDTPLGVNKLVPQRVVGRSSLGRHFEFTVDVVSTSGDIELKTLIAQPVTLWIQQSDKSYQPHNGYVHTARRLGSNGYAKISGVPAGTSAKVQYLTDKNPPRSEVGIKTDSDWSQFQSIKVTVKPVADAGNSNDPDLGATA